MYKSFSRYFESKFSLDRDITSIFIYKIANNKIHMFSKYSNTQSYDSLLYKHPERLEQVKDLSPVIRLYPSDHPIYSASDYVYSMGINIKTTDTFSPTGLMMVDFDVKGISTLLKQYYENVTSDTIILTSEGSVLFDSTGKYYGKKYPYIKYLDGKTSTAEIDGEKCLINVNSNNDSNILIAGITPEIQILKNIKTTKQAITIISFVFIFAALLLVYLGTQGFSKRVKTCCFTRHKRFGKRIARRKDKKINLA